FRCASDDCDTMHELPVLDWELHSLAQATRAKYGPSWATKFREMWGAPLAQRYDVHLLLSAYAQAPTKLYVAGLFYPPKVQQDALLVAAFVGAPAMVRGVFPLADGGRARVERHPLVDVRVFRLGALGIRFPV